MRLQLTPLFCESFCTEAVKLAVVETWTDVDVGLTETEIGGGVMIVILTEPEAVGSDIELAVRVTVAEFKRATGAV
jgi:hypothetical protein